MEGGATAVGSEFYQVLVSFSESTAYTPTSGWVPGDTADWARTLPPHQLLVLEQFMIYGLKWTRLFSLSRGPFPFLPLAKELD